jgi:hypothetical protein
VTRCRCRPILTLATIPRSRLPPFGGYATLGRHQPAHCAYRTPRDQGLVDGARVCIAAHHHSTAGNSRSVRCVAAANAARIPPFQQKVPSTLASSGTLPLRMRHLRAQASVTLWGRSSPSIIYLELLNCIIPHLEPLRCVSRVGRRTLRDRIARVTPQTDGLRDPACCSPYGAIGGSSAALCCLGYWALPYYQPPNPPATRGLCVSS